MTTCKQDGGGGGDFGLQCTVSMSQMRVRGERATRDVISCSTYISLSRPPDSSTPDDNTVRTLLVPHFQYWTSLRSPSNPFLYQYSVWWKYSRHTVIRHSLSTKIPETHTPSVLLPPRVGGSRSGASLPEGALWGEPGGRTPLLGTPKDMLSKALEIGLSFHMGPAFGEHGGALLF
jgi:hypothetical protein